VGATPVKRAPVEEFGMRDQRIGCAACNGNRWLHPHCWMCGGRGYIVPDGET
jgi:hypothetical protein